MQGVLAIVPAYNEEDLVGLTLQKLKELPEITDIILVNDGSTDRTGEEAGKVGVRVIDLGENRGKGRAVQEGLKGAGPGGPEVVALVDADLGETAGEISRLLGPVLEGDADMTVARFGRDNAGGGLGIAKGIAGATIWLSTGCRLVSPLSGQRVLKKKILEDMRALPPGFGLEFGLTLWALKKGYRVKEIDTALDHRRHGKSLAGFMHRGKQLVDIIKTYYLMEIKRV